MKRQRGPRRFHRTLLSMRDIERVLFGASAAEALLEVQRNLNRTSEVAYAFFLFPGLYDAERASHEASGL